jgi:hypothetical protein
MPFPKHCGIPDSPRLGSYGEFDAHADVVGGDGVRGSIALAMIKAGVGSLLETESGRNFSVMETEVYVLDILEACLPQYRATNM